MDLLSIRIMNIDELVSSMVNGLVQGCSRVPGIWILKLENGVCLSYLRRALKGRQHLYKIFPEGLQFG